MHAASDLVIACAALAATAAGAHILSGNVLQPTALDELLPGWREDEECPVKQPATASRFYYLTQQRALRLPNPPQMSHKGNFVISLRYAGWRGWPPEHDSTVAS